MYTVNNISIIISAYNAQDYIEECLDSIVKQTWYNDNNKYEILLGIDNCDKTLNIINKIKHKYKNLKVWWFQKNVGPYVVFNTLIQNSNYDVISVFGADDIMSNNFLEDNLKMMNDKTYVKAMGVNFTKNIDEIKHIKKGTNYCGIILFNKSDFLGVNGYANWMCGADTDINRRFSLIGLKTINCKVVTYYRRIHNNSLTNNKTYGKGSSYRKDIRNEILHRSSIKKSMNDAYVIFEKNNEI
jgi:glycosyltransferase involved in cell wall biosynthesis